MHHRRNDYRVFKCFWRLISKIATKSHCIFIFLKSWFKSKIHTIKNHYASYERSSLLSWGTSSLAKSMDLCKGMSSTCNSAQHIPLSFTHLSSLRHWPPPYHSRSHIQAVSSRVVLGCLLCSQHSSQAPWTRQPALELPHKG